MPKLPVIISALVLSSMPAFAQSLIRHHITVAAHPAQYLTNADVDRIMREMNQIAQTRDFSWDEACTNVEFVRRGDVISNSGIPVAGAYEDIVKKAKQVAPRANAIVVTQIQCGLVSGAIGCGGVGSEPMTVIPYDGFGGMLWLHERGHNVGLGHAPGEGTSDDGHPENVGKRVMFWSLGYNHNGLLTAECNRYRNKRFASGSIEQVTQTAALLAAQATATGANAQIPRYGLTDRAFEVVAPPWLHGMPIEQVKRLDETDLQSIRRMLSDGPPNAYWPNAMNTLGYRGKAEDVDIIARAIQMPMAALGPNPSDEARQGQRTLLRIKLAAPEALGVLAYRTGDAKAVATLKSAAQKSVAVGFVGDAASEAFAKSALRGLAISGQPDALEVVNKTLAVQASKFQSPGDVALTAKEAENLQNISDTIKKEGIEKVLTSTPTR